MKHRRAATAISIAIPLVGILSGCGVQGSRRPPQAVVFNPTARPAPRTWTKQDKIAAIQRAPISPDQKKAEIARVQAGQD